MTEYDIVSTLPTSLSCAVLRDWLDLKSTIKLNSAFCNTSRRETFLELLRSDEYSVLGQIMLPYHIDRLKASYSGLWELGGKVRRIFVCHKLSAAEAAFIVQQFPNLTHVHLSALDDTVSELWTLIRSPRMQCIKITYCTCHDASSFLAALQFSGHNICQMDLHEVQFEPSAFVQVARLCPHLISLGLGGAALTDNDLKEIVASCPHVRYLDLDGNTSLSDAGVLIVVQNLSLESLNLSDATGITDASLEHISSLHTLYLTSCEQRGPFFTNAAINQLLQRCTQLRTFSFSDSTTHWSYVEFEPASLQNLTTLMLMGECIFSGNVLAIGQHAVNLHTLSLSSVDTCSTNSLLALCNGCSNLNALYINFGYEIDEPQGPLVGLALHFWAQVKPKLKISTVYPAHLHYSVVNDHYKT